MPLRSGALQLLTFVCICAALLHSGCASEDGPPYYRAEITNVYKETFTVDRFQLLYWWEERGETPFLKPHSLSARELIVEVMRPLKDNPKRVTVANERYGFDILDTVEIVLVPGGKKIIINTKDGRRIQAENSFPKCLKVDPESGFADMKIFARGIRQAGGKAEEFKLALDFIKKIRILQKTDQ